MNLLRLNEIHRVMRLVQQRPRGRQMVSAHPVPRELGRGEQGGIPILFSENPSIGVGADAGAGRRP